MKKIFLLLISFFVLLSCKKDELPKKSADSIFLLDSDWQNQDNETLKLKDLQGKNLAVVMIFTSCKTSCPILVSDMQKIRNKIDKNKLDDTSLVLVSIDPKNDTPQVLKEFAQKRNIYGKPWVFLRSNEEATREFANVLAVKYKQISPVEFSHSNIISIFNRNGEMVSQEEGAGINAELVAKTLNELK